MLGIYWLKWWYSGGFRELAQRLRRRLGAVWSAFSVSLLLKTLFNPWRQIISGRQGGVPVNDRVQRLINNLVSRVVGFFVRILTVLAALLATLFIAIFGVVALVAWPLLPLIAIGLIVKGFGLL